MSDVKLSFGVDIASSSGEISRGIQEIVKTVQGSNGIKIKFSFDYNKTQLDSLHKKINEIANSAKTLQGVGLMPNVSNKQMSQATWLKTQASIAQKEELNNTRIAINNEKLRGEQIRNNTRLIQQRNMIANQGYRAEAQAMATRIKNNNKYNQLYDYMQKNKTAFKNPRYTALQQEGSTLMAKFFAGNEKDVRVAESQVSGFMSRCKHAGIEVESFGSKIQKLFTDHFNTAVAMVGVHLIQQGLRQLYQNVVNVDTAMTELKKVTNETDSAYDKFLNNASTRAKQLGATLSDTVNATADFARLGYNIEDSSQLADAALVYKNVGDGITDISEASESIISTIKAFNVEASDSMSIVDKYNEVGKSLPNNIVIY